MWMTSNWPETKNPMWKVLNKEVDLGEPTSFFDHVYLGCTQRQCEISKDIVDNYRTMFESRISAGSNRENTMLGKYSYFFVGLRYGRSCQEMCSQTVLKCLYLARIGRPDITWSVNKLARSITKWTKACDK